MQSMLSADDDNEFQLDAVEFKCDARMFHIAPPCSEDPRSDWGMWTDVPHGSKLLKVTVTYKHTSKQTDKQAYKEEGEGEEGGGGVNKVNCCILFILFWEGRGRVREVREGRGGRGEVGELLYFIYFVVITYSE